MRELILDVEATGTKDAQICQLAYIMTDGESLSARNWYFAVDEMNPYAQKVCNLSVKQLLKLSGGARFADAAPQIHRDLYWSQVYVGHGVAGDIDYLTREMHRLNLDMPMRRRFCTMHRFTGVWEELILPGGKPKPPRLEELWLHMGLTEQEIAEFADKTFGGGARAHDARFDASATYLALKRARLQGLV